MAPIPTPAYYPATATATPSLESAKVVGGIGCVLLFLMFTPSVGGLLAIAGLVMVGYALKRIGDSVHEPKILENYVYALVTSIVGVAVGVVVVVANALRVLGLENLSRNDWAGWVPTTTDAIGLALGFVVGLLIMWAALMLSAVFVRRTGELVADRLNVKLFRTAGTVYLVGAALSVLLVGFVVLGVAMVMFAVAFFSIEENRSGAPYPPPPFPPYPGQW
jgi:uncharacterized membrane protein